MLSLVGEIDEFDLSGTEDVNSAYDTLSEYKQLVKNQTGVRIFRDGFGIKPYGMGNDEWLNLSKGQTSGSFYFLRPDNVIGFISITAKENKHLTEKTDREGFIDNRYSQNFFKLIHFALHKNINTILDSTKRSFDVYKQRTAASKGNIKSFTDTKERLLTTAKQSIALEEETNRVSSEMNKVSAKVSEAVYKIKNEPLFSTKDENKALAILQEVEQILNNSKHLFSQLVVILGNAKLLENDANYLEPKIKELENQLIEFSELAGLGMTAEAFTHEMFNVIDRIGLQTDQVLKLIKKEGSGNTTFFIYVEHVKSFINSIQKQLNHLAPSLKFNRETKQEITISSFTLELKEYYTLRNDGKIEFNINPVADFVVNMNKGKFTQIVDNLILNSEYWLHEVSQSDSKFKPCITIEIKSPFIYISDNGYGIAPTFEETLFQPFVTSKPKGKGRGLGLFIVQQMLDSVGANVVLLNKRNEHNRRFIFQINLESNLINL